MSRRVSVNVVLALLDVDLALADLIALLLILR